MWVKEAVRNGGISKVKLCVRSSLKGWGNPRMKYIPLRPRLGLLESFLVMDLVCSNESSLVLSEMMLRAVTVPQ